LTYEVTIKTQIAIKGMEERGGGHPMFPQDHDRQGKLGGGKYDCILVSVTSMGVALIDSKRLPLAK